jgi:AraC-like DNA-binding protein
MSGVAYVSEERRSSAGNGQTITPMRASVGVISLLRAAARASFDRSKRVRMIASATTELTSASCVPNAVSSVSMHVVRVMMDVVGRAGVSRERMLRATGLEEAQLNEPVSLSYEAAIQIAETLLELSADPAFGLRWAESISVDTFSPTTYLVTNAATLGKGIDALLQYSKLLSDRPHLTVHYDANAVRLACPPRLGGSPAVQRMAAEISVIAFVRIVRAFHPTFRPERVCFAYPAPSYRDEYTRIFECVAEFDQPFTGLVFDRALLAAKAPYRDQGVHDALCVLAEQRMSTREQAPRYAARVRSLLIQRRRVGGPAMVEIAAQLGLSVHALRRRLTAEATTFAALEHEAFASLVDRLLIDDQHTIQEVAYELGFSGTASFHRAFKRALGITPLAYLHAQLAARSAT